MRATSATISVRSLPSAPPPSTVQPVIRVRNARQTVRRVRRARWSPPASACWRTFSSASITAPRSRQAQTAAPAPRTLDLVPSAPTHSSVTRCSISTAATTTAAAARIKAVPSTVPRAIRPALTRACSAPIAIRRRTAACRRTQRRSPVRSAPRGASRSLAL